jgi:hypothetical protein
MVWFSGEAEIFLVFTSSKLDLGHTHFAMIMIMEVSVSGQRSTAVLLIIIDQIIVSLFSLIAH